MSKEFNTVLMNAYNQFRDHPDPPIPLELIKDYLKDEGLLVEEQDVQRLIEHQRPKNIPFKEEKAVLQMEIYNENI
jgi:hypothetical protein